MLQILRKIANDFTPDGGSNISFNVDHLECDDYIVGTQTLISNIAWRHWCERSDGDFRLQGDYNFARNQIVKIPSTLDSIVLTNLSDGDNVNKTAMCLDNNDDIYFVRYNPGQLKKYNDAGIWQWTYAGLGSSPGVLSLGIGCFFYNNLIFVTSSGNNYIFIVDTNGNFVNEINTTLGGSTLTEPNSIWVDNTGIYVLGLNNSVARWDSTTYAFIENLPTLPFPTYITKIYINLMRLSNGDFVLRCLGGSNYQTLGLFLLNSSMEIKRELEFPTHDPNGDLPKGGIREVQSGYTATLIDETNEYLYMACYVGANTVKLLKMNTKGASERFAEYQHDFGLSVNIQRLDVNALYDNRDETWKSMRLWYQLDGGGYVEVDMKDPLLAINGQVLDLRVGMTSYGFLRHWPEFYSIDILYDDGLTPSYEYPITGKVINEVSIKGVVSAN